MHEEFALFYSPFKLTSSSNFTFSFSKQRTLCCKETRKNYTFNETHHRIRHKIAWLFIYHHPGWIKLVVRLSIIIQSFIRKREGFSLFALSQHLLIFVLKDDTDRGVFKTLSKAKIERFARIVNGLEKLFIFITGVTYIELRWLLLLGVTGLLFIEQKLTVSTK